jgi:uncharacterized protein (DUF2384 family)
MLAGTGIVYSRILPNGTTGYIICHMDTATRLKQVDLADELSADPAITDEEAAAMFRAVLSLFRRWRLRDEQAAVLLDVPLRTFRRWKAGDAGRLGRDGRARLSNLMGIHKALRLIFAERQRGYDWIKAPNTAFGGQSALEVMLGGDLTDLIRVRRYLDAERGW